MKQPFYQIKLRTAALLPNHYQIKFGDYDTEQSTAGNVV